MPLWRRNQSPQRKKRFKPASHRAAESGAAQGRIGEKRRAVLEGSNSDDMKYIYVTGGVVSGLGKGVTASSIGVLLKSLGLR